MSRMCFICGKTPMSGNKVSKSYNHTRRSWRPNLIRMKADVMGTTKTITICTRCLRSDFSGITKKVNVPKATATETK